MLRRAVFVGTVAVATLGLLVPAGAKPADQPVTPDASDPTAVVPGPSTQAILTELVGGGFGSSHWSVSDASTNCVDDYTDEGLAIEDASLNDDDANDDDDPGTFDDAFDGALMLWVNDELFVDTNPATDDATFYNSGPLAMSGLQVSVSYRTFSDQPAIRQLVTLTNPTGAPISAEVISASETGTDSPSDSDTGTEIVGTGSGDLVVSPSDSFFTVNDDSDTDNDPVDTLVMFGTGAPLQPSGFAPGCAVLGDGSGGEDELGVVFDVTVPAGQTVYLMFFGAIDVDDASALAHAQELVSLTCDSPKLADLTDAELNSILNWNLECLEVAFTG